MHCADVQHALSHLAYDDVNPEAKRTLDEHVASCPACQAELAALKNIKGLLDQMPAPPVRVDVARIYEEGQARQERRLRLWRRTAVAVAGVAALLAVALISKLEIRADSKQLVLSWAPADAAQVSKTHLTAPAVLQPSNPDQAQQRDITREDLELMRDLIHALAADADNRDRKLHESLGELQNRLELMNQEAQRRWAATVRYVAANSQVENQEGGSP